MILLLMQFLPGGAIKVAGAHLQIASNLLKPKNIQNLILDTLERYVFFFSFDTILIRYLVFFLVTIRYFGLRKDLLLTFFWVRKWALLAKSDQKKWHFEWPNQNSKTTFIVQTFPKYGPYGFDLVNLSLLGPILAKFQFCWFSGLFWPFFPCKWGQTRKSFAERQFLVYNAEIFFVNSYNPWAWLVKRTKLNSKKV